MYVGVSSSPQPRVINSSECQFQIPRRAASVTARRQVHLQKWLGGLLTFPHSLGLGPGSLYMPWTSNPWIDLSTHGMTSFLKYFWGGYTIFILSMVTLWSNISRISYVASRKSFVTDDFGAFSPVPHIHVLCSQQSCLGGQDWGVLIRS
jgi:hypothetical protein